MKRARVVKGVAVAVAVAALTSCVGRGAPARFAPRHAPAPPSCAAEPIRRTGTTFHVCDCESGASERCVPGDDANPGTSAIAPKRSLAAAVATFERMRPGDTVAFCRGGSWPSAATLTWTNGRCTAANTCDVRAYDPPWGGGGARPRFTMRAGASFASWSSGSAAHEGFRFQGLAIQGDGGSGWGFFLYSPVNYVLFCDLVVSGFGIGFQVEELNHAGDGTTTTRRRIELVGSTVAGNREQGWLGAAAGARVLDNVFAENGTTNRDHNIYLAAHAGVANGMVVRGNHLSRSGGHGGKACRATELVAHAVMADLVIEGNTIEEVPGEASEGCWGIELDDQGDASLDDRFERAIVRGNVIEYVGNQSISIGSAHDTVIENNLIVANARGGGIVVGERPSYDHVPYEVAAVTVRNNTVYFTSGQSHGIRIARAGDGRHEVYSNALYLAGDGNRCEIANGVVYDAHNLCTTMANDSWFADAPGDFRPKLGSPLIRAGSRRGGPAPATDLSGASRPQPPSVGAFEP